MDRWILTAICVASLSLAGSMAWRWRGLERIDRRDEEVPRGWAAARGAVRSLAVMVNAGIITGVLVCGFGGRLVMRVLAATSDDLVQGNLTDAEKPIGQVTRGGTIELLIFGGLFSGLIGAMLYRLLRPWLPAKAWQAGALIGVIAIGAFGKAFEVLSRDNPDFEVLSPAPLAVALLVLLAVVSGVVLVPIYERLDRGMAHLGHLSIGLLAFAPLLLASLTPLTGPVFVLVVLIAVFAPELVQGWTTSPGVARVGRLVVGTATIGAVAVTALEVAAITT